MYVSKGCNIDSGPPNGAQTLPAAFVAYARKMLAAESNAMDRAQNSYAAGQVQSPLDFKSMGINIMKDVQDTFKRGSGGPAGRLAPGGFFGGGGPEHSYCETDTKRPTQAIPMEASLSRLRQIPNRTGQGVDVPDVPASTVVSHCRSGMGDAYPASCETVPPVSDVRTAASVPGANLAGLAVLFLGIVGIGYLARQR